MMEIDRTQYVDFNEETLQTSLVEGDNKITENSETILIDQATSRFSDAVWYNNVQKKTVLLAGLGGIGSYVCYLLSRMKPYRVLLYDPDIVEGVNLAGQMYCINDIGNSKALAMSDMMHKYSSYFSFNAMQTEYSETSAKTDIMICGFDNMEARRIFFENWLNHVSNVGTEHRKHCLFLDGRLSAEELQVLCIRGDDAYNIQRYRNEWLFSDDEAQNELCSYKQTTFMANMIGSIMVNLFVNFCANDIEGDEAPLIERDLPFLTEYDAATMMFHTEA